MIKETRFTIVLILLLLIKTNLFAHKDTTFVKTYNNVRVITTTGSTYEEVNKTFIIGQYLHKLCVELGVKDTINIHFRHSYATNRNKFFNVEKSENYYINVVYRKSNFDILQTLNLIEYVLINNKSIDKLSEEKVEKIEEKIPSPIVETILKCRIYRPTEITQLNIDTNFSYYIENNLYYVYQSNEVNPKIKLILNNVYQINSISKTSLIVFDSKESFFYVNSIGNNDPKKVKFNNRDNYYYPFLVNKLTKDIVSIKLSKRYNDEKLMLYLIKKNRLKFIE